MPGRVYTDLLERAMGQHGFVTPADARALGVDPAYLRVLAKRELLEHPARGVYRFPIVPPGRLDEYAQAVLWPADVIGTLSHDTALDLYELSDINPGQIHLTVPARYRTNRAVPAQYAIHRADLPADDMTRWEGLPIVTVRRAIADAIDTDVRAGLIEQAIETARARAQLRRGDVAKLRARLRARLAAA